MTWFTSLDVDAMRTLPPCRAQASSTELRCAIWPSLIRPHRFARMSAAHHRVMFLFVSAKVRLIAICLELAATCATAGTAVGAAV